ncbi:hypothetical protein NAEGRDRAFT_78468 [Naegleria gruberi]|uniref:Uncharacterized protein n=1 Tax=Naegleria gruberi TaxID=5762 RepID=D2V402_NAEGR|nr:uncharacterized protein NAEGRDRAFT_78468 [Naegleria gruberi]EFC48439.1 hypothetical protein NAEGRDRAFT_78468 [Naegleria gruberi]|eukprot:XP_002681183.1 hypothetical protein NAEGRDRAFT_78468 [Naegleria gruberi strain NEG-M]
MDSEELISVVYDGDRDTAKQIKDGLIDEKYQSFSSYLKDVAQLKSNPGSEYYEKITFHCKGFQLNYSQLSDNAEFKNAKSTNKIIIGEKIFREEFNKQEANDEQGKAQILEKYQAITEVLETCDEKEQKEICILLLSKMLAVKCKIEDE